MRRLIRMCKRALPRVACPVLVVQAEQDDVTGPKNAQFIIERVGSSRRELLLLKQSYHLVSADLERSTVADHLQNSAAPSPCLRRAPKAERSHARSLLKPVLFFDFDNTSWRATSSTS